MKILSIAQPWAHVIVHGPKRVENRSWPTRYRGPLLIHAGKTHSWIDWSSAHLWPGHYGIKHPELKDMTFGAILAVCDLAACVNVNELSQLDKKAADWLRQHPFTEGPWAWVLKNVRPLSQPVPCRGQQGLWDVSADLLARCGLGEGS